MKFTSEKSIEILEHALKFENNSAAFYRECLSKAENPGAATILKSLVEDEQKHADIIKQLIEEARRDGSATSVATSAAEGAKTSLEQALQNKAMTDDTFAPENADVQALLTKALDIEKESFETYSRASEESEEDEAKAVYRYLAQEENRHYVIIDNLIGYLDDPGRWLYEEENLIYHL